MQVERIGNATLYCGDCLDILPSLPTNSVGMVCTDPPYCSSSNKNLMPEIKYQNTGSKLKPTFSGDNRDQRALQEWTALWARYALSISEPSAVIACFIDWRNIACVVDAIQVAGWTYHALNVWDKTSVSKPQHGWFRAQAEFIVCGTNGSKPRGYTRNPVYVPGVFSVPYIHASKRFHMTEKPVAVLSQLLKVSRDGCTVLDCFMGSGSTGIAALESGRTFVGIEKSEEYFDIACGRLERFTADLRLI